jgi:hypothetical protein
VHLPDGPYENKFDVWRFDVPGDLVIVDNMLTGARCARAWQWSIPAVLVMQDVPTYEGEPYWLDAVARFRGE